MEILGTPNAEFMRKISSDSVSKIFPTPIDVFFACVLLDRKALCLLLLPAFFISPFLSQMIITGLLRINALKIRSI